MTTILPVALPASSCMGPANTSFSPSRSRCRRNAPAMPPGGVRGRSPYPWRRSRQTAIHSSRLSGYRHQPGDDSLDAGLACPAQRFTRRSPSGACGCASWPGQRQGLAAPGEDTFRQAIGSDRRGRCTCASAEARSRSSGNCAIASRCRTASGRRGRRDRSASRPGRRAPRRGATARRKPAPAGPSAPKPRQGHWRHPPRHSLARKTFFEPARQLERPVRSPGAHRGGRPDRRAPRPALRSARHHHRRGSRRSAGRPRHPRASSGRTARRGWHRAPVQQRISLCSLSVSRSSPLAEQHRLAGDLPPGRALRARYGSPAPALRRG